MSLQSRAPVASTPATGDAAPLASSSEQLSSNSSAPYGNASASEDASSAPVRRGGLSYVVRGGDSLWSIANANDGSGSYWDDIASANPSECPDGHTILIGDALMLPMQDVSGEPGAAAPAPGADTPSITPASRFVEIVERGDGAAALAFVPRLRPEDLATVRASPSPITRLPTVQSVPLLQRLTIDVWATLLPTLDAGFFTSQCDSVLAPVLLAAPTAVDDVRRLVPDNAAFDLFLRAYNVPLQASLAAAGFNLAAGAPGAAADFDLIVRICTRISQAERQGVLLGIRHQGKWEALVAALGPQHVAMVQSWIAEDAGDNTNQTLDQRIAAAHNSERGVAALARVNAVAATDTHAPARITDRLKELLVLGVALSRLDTDDLASEGVLGAVQAERAAQALVGMPDNEYLRTVMLLELSGDASRLNQSFLVLKAVAARADRYAAGGAGGALTELEGFTDGIRDLDNQQVVERTTVTSVGGQGALTQQFSMSCAATSAIGIRAEADPVEAARLHDDNALSINALGGAVAREAEQGLEAQSAGGTLVAHVRNDQGTPADQSDVNTAITELAGHTPAVQLQAVAQYMAGVVAGTATYTQANYDLGIAAIRAHVNANGSPNDQAMRVMHETVIQNGIAYDASGNPTGLASPLPAAVVTSMRNALDGAAAQLVNGVDVEIVVWWANGGAHAMAFMDVRGSGASRSFLLHDTWAGVSAWVPQSQILQGNIAGGQGLLGATYH